HPPDIYTLPYTTLFRSAGLRDMQLECAAWSGLKEPPLDGIQFDIQDLFQRGIPERLEHDNLVEAVDELRSESPPCCFHAARLYPDRKSTRLNSSHDQIS